MAEQENKESKAPEDINVLRENPAPKKRNIMELVILYHADPFETRSVQRYCEDNGFTRQSFYEYLKHHREEIFSEADRLRKQYRSQMTSELFKAMMSLAKKNPKALQIALEITGNYIPKSEQRVEYLSADEKKQKLKLFLDKIQNKKGPPSTPDTPEGVKDAE